MVNVAFTVGPLDAGAGAGLTVATAGWAKALVRSGGARVNVFGRKPRGGIEAESWGDAAVVARGRPGSRLREFDLGLAGAIAASAPEIIHAHGLWLAHQWSAWRAAERLGVPRIVAPHGHLDAWARARSTWKKKLAWIFYQRAALRSAACLHALHDGEAAAIRAAGLANPVCVVPNGIDPPAAGSGPAPWNDVFPADAKVLLFLGRIGEQKGAVELVRAWSQVGRDAEVVRGRWKLALAGWPEAEALDAIRAEIARAGTEDSVRVFGPQLGSAKTNCFANAAAFVLPSRSEGLPMAILEAWSHALPVAMTRACNLPSGFAEGAAVEIELESDKLAAGLREFLLMPDEVRTGLGRQGRRLTTTVFSWDCVAQQMLAVYAWCLRQREAPATIRFA